MSDDLVSGAAGEAAVFDPEAFAASLRDDLPAALEALAQLLRESVIDGWYLKHAAHGFGVRADSLGLDVTLRLHVPCRVSLSTNGKGLPK